MKLLNWLNRKTSHSQQNEERDLQLHHNKHDLEFTHQNNTKINSFGPVKENLKQKRERVRIFVNHEEYGLLAIGTFGYDTTYTSSIQPHTHNECTKEEQDINIRSVENEERDSAVAINSNSQDQKAIILHQENHQDQGLKSNNSENCAKNRVFPLEMFGRSHLPQFGAGFKLVDRILHPLSFLNSMHISKNIVLEQQAIKNDQQEKKKNVASVLKKMLLKRGSPAPPISHVQKKITYAQAGASTSTSSSSSSSASLSSLYSSTSSTSSDYRNKLMKKALSHFSCMSIKTDDDHNGEEERDDDDRDFESSVTGEAYQIEHLEEDYESELSQNHTETYQTEPEHLHVSNKNQVEELQDSESAIPNDVSCAAAPYWIRTDSDYVVLEL